MAQGKLPTLDLGQDEPAIKQLPSPIYAAVTELLGVGYHARNAGNSPLLEVEGVLAGHKLGSVHVHRHAVDRNTAVLQSALSHQVNGEVRYVDADEAAVEIAGRRDRGSTAAERIEHDCA